MSHKNVCQIFEVGDEGGLPFLVMELLEGEPLSARLARGPMDLPQAVEVALGVLAALEALHARGIVHRDVKPSNVFLTSDGVKVLDFGLARSGAAELGQTASVLTLPGTVLGTPRYMAPEQLRGGEADARSDVFSVGAMLFEVLTGRPAFGGRTIADVCHATLHEQPPALAGSPAVVAVDLVIRRALAKNPADRPVSAAAMAEALRRAARLDHGGEAPRARAITRLVVLPFKPLRPDPDTEFLAFSVPDAITHALSGLGSLVVRSSIVAARHAGDPPDLARLASAVEVDVVLTGTLLRAGDRIRVSTQLVEAPGGQLVWSHQATLAMEDVFALQDELVRRILDSLSVTLTARENHMLHQDVPASPNAYEYYLRANRLAQDSAEWDSARSFYERCVEEDPRYAPAWARLGRIYRLQAKYGGRGLERLRQAENAFRRALELNPDLPLAHDLYTHLQVEDGHAREALVRLLGRCATASDAALFAGLVTATRYCGLLDESLAAHAHARRLDPAVRTSVGYTHFMRGDYAAALESDEEYLRWYSLPMLGRSQEVIEGLRKVEASTRIRGERTAARLQLAAHERDLDALRRCAADFENTLAFRDPEAHYFEARGFAYAGATSEALVVLRRVVDGGFTCVDALARDPWLDPLRGEPAFAECCARAAASRDAARAAYEAAGGPALLAQPQLTPGSTALGSPAQ